MKIGKQQIGFFVLALASTFVAWLSLGGIIGCAHFNVAGFCGELMRAGELELKEVLSSQCKTLANRAELICGQYFNLGVSALVVSSFSSIIFIGQVIAQNIGEKSENGSS